jgi:hypothetical protein
VSLKVVVATYREKNKSYKRKNPVAGNQVPEPGPIILGHWEILPTLIANSPGKAIYLLSMRLSKQGEEIISLLPFVLKAV